MLQTVKSILQDEKRCYLCGGTNGLERHHIFGGSNRKWSERLGLWVWLCGTTCHRGKNGAQYDPVKNRMLKMDAQYQFEQTHTRAEWMTIFKKNYL